MSEATEQLNKEESFTFEDLGIRPRDAPTDSVLGKRRTWRDLDTIDVIFLVTAVIGIILVLIITTQILVYTIIYTSYKNHAFFTFALVLWLNTGFNIYYLFYGVLSKRPYFLAIFVASVFLLLVFVTYSFATNESIFGYSSRQIVWVSLLWIICSINIGLGIYLTYQYTLSNDLIFRTVGANINLQEACKNAFFTGACLIFDYQLMLDMIILILTEGLYAIGVLEILVLAIGIPYITIYMIIGFLSIKLENISLVICFYALSPAQIVYVIFKMIQTSVLLSKDLPEVIVNANSLLNITYVPAIVALLVHVLLIRSMWKTQKNFGMGLRQKAFSTVDLTASSRSGFPLVKKKYSTFSEAE